DQRGAPAAQTPDRFPEIKSPGKENDAHDGQQETDADSEGRFHRAWGSEARRVVRARSGHAGRCAPRETRRIYRKPTNDVQKGELGRARNPSPGRRREAAAARTLPFGRRER